MSARDVFLVHSRRHAALHKKPWAVIDRPYSLGFATVGALYERPRYISCAKPAAGETSPKARVLGISGTVLSLGMASIVAWDLAWYLCLAAAGWAALEIFLLPTLNSATGKRIKPHVVSIGNGIVRVFPAVANVA